jgi:hypothetical protein
MVKGFTPTSITHLLYSQGFSPKESHILLFGNYTWTIESSQTPFTTQAAVLDQIKVDSRE